MPSPPITVVSSRRHTTALEANSSPAASSRAALGQAHEECRAHVAEPADTSRGIRHVVAVGNGGIQQAALDRRRGGLAHRRFRPHHPQAGSRGAQGARCRGRHRDPRRSPHRRRRPRWYPAGDARRPPRRTGPQAPPVALPTGRLAGCATSPASKPPPRTPAIAASQPSATEKTSPWHSSAIEADPSTAALGRAVLVQAHKERQDH